MPAQVASGGRLAHNSAPHSTAPRYYRDSIVDPQRLLFCRWSRQTPAGSAPPPPSPPPGRRRPRRTIRRAATTDSDLATLFTFTPPKPPITPIEGGKGCGCWVEQNRGTRPTSPQTVHVCGTPRTVRCAAFFVRSEKSNALVGDGFPQFRRARRTSTAPSVWHASSCCTAPASPSQA